MLGSRYEVILYTVHQLALQHHRIAVRYLASLDSRPQSKTQASKDKMCRERLNGRFLEAHTRPRLSVLHCTVTQRGDPGEGIPIHASCKPYLFVRAENRLLANPGLASINLLCLLKVPQSHSGQGNDEPRRLQFGFTSVDIKPQRQKPCQNLPSEAKADADSC